METGFYALCIQRIRDYSLPMRFTYLFMSASEKKTFQTILAYLFACNRCNLKKNRLWLI